MPGPRPSRARRAPRPTRGRRAALRRWLHGLLLTLVVAGLTPLAEVLDLALAGVHPATAVTAACDDGCDDGCDAAGCHGEVHHCGCCATVASAAPSPGWAPSGLRARAHHPRPRPLLGPPDRAPPPPWMPPRA